MTWTQANATGTGWASVAASADATKLVAAETHMGGGGDIYTSIDSGMTWTQTRAPSNNWTSVASSADGTKLAGVIYGAGIYSSHSEPPPSLSIALSGGIIIIAWPTSSAGFVLQQTSDLTRTGWSDIPTSPTVTNKLNQLFMSPSLGNLFYRLKGR